jgi:hypothetical protein
VSPRSLDFLIASEVFEHVRPPISRAFQRAEASQDRWYPAVHDSIQQRGWCSYARTLPDLQEFTLSRDAEGGWRLRNVTKSGDVQLFDNLVFHGGKGLTLEMRLFSEASLVKEFLAAGFDRPRIYKQHDFVHGIYWSHDWSLPMAARAVG